MDENVLRKLTPDELVALEREGFDRTDPSGPWVVVFTIAIVVTLVVVVFGVDYLFHETLAQNEYEQVLSQDSPELQEIRTKEAEALNHYRYVDKEKKGVRLPIDRAMQLFATEAAQGKLFYPAKPTPFKTPEQLAAAAGAAPAGGAPSAATPGQPANAGAGVAPKQ